MVAAVDRQLGGSDAVGMYGDSSDFGKGIAGIIGKGAMGLSKADNMSLKTQALQNKAMQRKLDMQEQLFSKMFGGEGGGGILDQLLGGFAGGGSNPMQPGYPDTGAGTSFNIPGMPGYGGGGSFPPVGGPSLGMPITSHGASQPGFREDAPGQPGFADPSMGQPGFADPSMSQPGYADMPPTGGDSSMPPGLGMPIQAHGAGGGGISAVPGMQP